MSGMKAVRVLPLLVAPLALTGCRSDEGAVKPQATASPAPAVNVPGFGDGTRRGDEFGAEFPWRKKQTVPADLMTGYVLSAKFLDEEQRPWREEMFRRFGPLVANCHTREEAILLIAKNAAKLCGAEYSVKRRAANQCAMETLESGKASCTGLSILLAAAYRSVGIPARIVGVGEWSDRQGNHTWVEVWDGDWHVIDYYPDAKGWDRGWIFDPIANLEVTNPNSRVMAVDPHGESSFFLPWDETNTSVRATDRTAHYVKLAAQNGAYRKKARSGFSLVPVVAHDASGKRVAVAFRILDADREIFAATTPGPLDDMNNTPRAELSLKKEYVFEYASASGGKESVRFVAGSAEQAVLPVR